MDLLVEGLSYRAAPLEVRERVFIPGEGLSRRLVIDAAQVDRLTRALAAKLLHGPISYLREHPEDASTAMLVRDLFQLDQDRQALEVAG